MSKSERKRGKKTIVSTSLHNEEVLVEGEKKTNKLQIQYLLYWEKKKI